MVRFKSVSLVCVWLAICFWHATYADIAQAEGGADQLGNAPKVEVELITDVSAIVPGRPFQVGLRQVIAPRWHTYWKNPGDSGEPTRIDWRLPDGFSASAIKWPTPEALPVGPLMNHGYSEEVLLPVTITPPKQLASSEVTLTAEAAWLVCEKICIPEEATISIKLPVAARDASVAPSRSAADFDAARRDRPIANPWQVSIAPGNGLSLRVAASNVDWRRIRNVHFFADAWGLVDHAAPQRASWSTNGLELNLKPGELVRADKPVTLSGVLVLTEDIGGSVVRNAFQVVARSTGPAAAGSGPAEPGRPGGGAGSTADPSGLTLWQAMLFAALGGIILNAMPCVLPILSLKVMSLAKHSGAAASRGLAYLVGVLASFAALAAILMALKAAGENLGWGFQFQSPAFVLLMIALFFFFGLSMSGVFDIGGNIIGAGEGLTRRQGLAGSFFTGALATIAATPCTAPFMGAAVGFALTRSNAEMFAVLTALGFGFALPIVVLSLTDAARRVLPKPGAWMETLKQALAFPLYATVAWLVWVLSLQTGSTGVLAAGIVLTGSALAAWLIGRPMASLPVRSGLAVAVATIVIAAIANLLPLASAAPASGLNPSARSASADMFDAEPFSQARLNHYRTNGRPVFVNMTAAWCISCKVNERVALSTDGFRNALKTHNVAYLKGDWTNRNNEIAAVLRTFGRAGVPLYLLYPADASAEPVVLPQILTEAIVVSHIAGLNRAATGPDTTGD
jgi:thiol:disulfide interchange protein/DsbC/DsbD-like thiol-disulfide interchange protein